MKPKKKPVSTICRSTRATAAKGAKKRPSGTVATKPAKKPEPSLPSAAPTDMDSLVAYYNTRLPSSTPNTTLQGPANHKTDSASIRTKKNPDWPIVLTDLSYSLTSGQSHPLNSSEQVRIIKPPEKEPSEPKLYHGRVEFHPNPESWFRNTVPIVQQRQPLRAFDPVQIPTMQVSAEKENVDFSLYSDTAAKPIVIPQMLSSEKDNLTTKIPPASQNPPSKIPANALNLANPKFRDAMQSLKSALKEEALRNASQADKQHTKPARKPKTKPSIKPKPQKETSCSRCSRFDLKKSNATKVDKKVQFSSPTIQSPRELPIDNLSPKSAQISQQSLRHMNTLQRLLVELKAATSADRDVEIHSLATQVEQTAAMFVPGLGGIDWHMELELAMQPIRSENAQLRRKLRIMNQKVKDSGDSAEKPVHTAVELQKITCLEEDLRESRQSLDELRDALRLAQTQVDQLQREKAQFMEIIADKDSERRLLEQKFDSNIQQLQRDLSYTTKLTQDSKLSCGATQQQIATLQAEKRELKGKVTQLDRTVTSKDEEISRLTGLVKNLQGSMTRLLGNLKSLTPKAETKSEKPRASSSEKDRIQIVGVEPLDSSIDPDEQTTPTNSPRPLKAPSSACRALPFSASAEKGEVTPPSSPNIGLSSTTSTSPGGWDADTTDYLLAPGTSPIKLPKASVKAPTVKELLTPIADRMKDQYKRLSLGSGASPQTAEPIPPDPPTNPASSAVPDSEMSRYSVTDYFRKYSARPEELANREQQTELTQHTLVEEDDLSSSLGVEENALEENLYKDTVLDTSISTIDDLMSVASSAFSGTSVGSVDDSAFRQGLEELDANIARIQEQLKLNLVK